MSSGNLIWRDGWYIDQRPNGDIQVIAPDGRVTMIPPDELWVWRAVG